MTLCLLFATFNIVTAAIKLPSIFSDNMVLQRNATIKIWGWSDKNATVSAILNGQTVKAKANRQGYWMVTFPPMPHGGPYQMNISDRSGTVQLSNILIGDVWLGSGQSNMEWVVKNSNHATEEVAAGNYDKLRLFTVKTQLSYTPKDDFAADPWQVCSSRTVGDFSAVAYFFGRKLMEELDVPIGLINSSWGGTNIQTWISWDFMSTEDEYKYLSPEEHAKTAAETATRLKQYQQALKDDKGLAEKWFDISFQPSGWKTMDLPQEWGSTELASSDGIVWFRKEITLPAGVENQKALLSLGRIDDRDDTYVNGIHVGTSSDYLKDRQYALQPNQLKQGKNFIVVKVTDTGGGGGLNGRKDQLFLDVNGQRIALTGAWQYKSSVLTTDFGVKESGPNTFPSQLYNAMIAPLKNFGIKGVIWYQGEANVREAAKYQQLFPALIKDWRSKWGYDFPFLWIQLANYLAPSAQPQESQWAALRDAQTMTLQLPGTGQALAIDIGDANDVHPRNKQDVGLRLALVALKVAYGKDIVHSGPVYKSMIKEGNKIKLTFSNVGGGLVAKGDKYGYLRGFAIAGSDKKFVWAKAHIEGDQVIVYSDHVKEPVVVRYAWADNPDDANLYNAEGLPACPFKTNSDK